MSFVRDENDEVHESDSGFNPDVVDVIGIVKNSHDVKECINAIASGRSAIGLRSLNSQNRINYKKEWTRNEIGIQAERE